MIYLFISNIQKHNPLAFLNEPYKRKKKIKMIGIVIDKEKKKKIVSITELTIFPRA
jgi:hypothetical protein